MGVAHAVVQFALVALAVAPDSTRGRKVPNRLILLLTTSFSVRPRIVLARVALATRIALEARLKADAVLLLAAPLGAGAEDVSRILQFDTARCV